MSFAFKISETAGNTQIHFSGSLDENSKLPDNADTFHGNLILNMADVNQINSMGCRTWVNWIKSLKAEGQIRLAECSAPVIGQANILIGFLPGHVKVDSFFVPYSCPMCNGVQLKLYNTKDAFVNGQVTVKEKIPCAKCGGSQSFDMMPQKYFTFLRR